METNNTLSNDETTLESAYYKLTINYHANGATTLKGSYTDGTSITKVSTVFPSTIYDNGLPNYTNPDSTILYLAREGYTATGYWGTEENGGILVHQDTVFDSGLELALTLGKDISNQNQTVDIYAQWEPIYVKVYADYNGELKIGTLYARDSNGDFKPTKELYNKDSNGIFNRIK